MLGVMLFYHNENIYQQSNSKLEDSINSSSMSFSHKSSYDTFQLNNESSFMPFSSLKKIEYILGATSN